MDNKNKKRKTRKKIDKYAKRRMIVLGIILIVIIIIIGIVGKEDKVKYKDLKVLINNEEISFKDVKVESNEIVYFSLSDVSNIFDKNIYYNDAEKELITTYNKHVALLKIDETFMVVNDSNIDLNGRLKEINKKVYLPINDLEIVYDIEVDYSEDENIVIIDSINKELTEAKTLKKVNVKEKNKLFSKCVQKIEEGSKIFVIGEENKYYKIRTESGIIGYVKKNKVSELTKIRENYEENKLSLNILEDNAEVKIYDEIKIEENKLNVVNPSVVYLDKNSEIATNAVVASDTFKEYAKNMDEKNIYLMPSLKNSGKVSSNLLTYAQRNKFINELYIFVVTNSAKGVYIDFEEIDDINSFYRFLIELTPKFKESGLYVIVENNNLLDKTKLESIVDYVVEEK